jgi:hypothetical protein
MPEMNRISNARGTGFHNRVREHEPVRGRGR